MTPGDFQKISVLKSKKIHMLQVMIIIFTVCFKYNLCFSLIVSLVLVNCVSTILIITATVKS